MVYAGLDHTYNHNNPRILRLLNIHLKILGIQNS